MNISPEAIRAVMATRRIFAFSLSMLVILCLVLFSGCSRCFEIIRDIRELPQDHRQYLAESGASRTLISGEVQAGFRLRFLRWFFSPWHQPESPYSREAAEAFFNRYLGPTGEGKKRGSRHQRAIKAMVRNADLCSFPNSARRAITVRHADMRGLPTGRPLADPDVRMGPSPLLFDRLQVTSVPASTPVFISHWSRDRKWCLAETGYAFGWLSSRDLALVDAPFIAAWESGAYAVVVKDHVSVPVRRGQPVTASIGSLFPQVGESSGALEILVATGDARGHAVAVRAMMPKDTAAASPLPLTLERVADLANEFMDTPYGWGGQQKRRDCSSMLRDLFVPFGIWLPRHSADQALEGGRFIDLAGKDREGKREALATQGVPYLTLLWLKGHIMLYIGQRDGEPLVFHNFWSVRTTNAQGRSGKKVIGRAAITTLHPGREFQPPGSLRGDLLGALQGMTVLVPSFPSNFLVKRSIF